MTADIESRSKSNGSNTLLFSLSLIFAVLTILFAVLSMIFGNRLTRLHAHYLNMQNMTAKSESTSNRQMQAALNKATLNFQAARQSLDAEKTANQSLRQQLTAIRKDLEKSRAALAVAKETIARLKSRLRPQPAPAAKPPQTAPRESQPSGSISVPAQPSAATPPASAAVSPAASPSADQKREIGEKPVPQASQSSPTAASATE
jgi:hypothetical protein